MEINMKPYNFLDSFKEKDIYTWDEIVGIIEDLECELHNKEEELEDFKKELEENYERKKVDYYYEYGISEKDF